MSQASVITDNEWVNVDRLRAETRQEHEATEALVPLMHAGLTREQYIETLRRMYTVVRGWESWASGHAPASYASLLIGRQRGHLILNDLEVLDGEVPHQDDTLANMLTAQFLQGNSSQVASVPDFLGAMYVMEGSTLGGQYIARHVEEKLTFAPGEGDAYFRGYLERTGSMWQNFKQNLLELPETDGDAVIAAAKFMFRAFGATMSQRDSATDITGASM